MKRRRAEESADGLSPAVARYQQRFALALKIQQMTLCVDNQSQDTSRELQWIQSQASLLLYIQSTWYPDARKAKVAKLGNQTQATAHPVESFYEPAVALCIQSQRSRRNDRIQQKSKAVVDMNQQ
ncbi:hypothetical protein F511_46302 [Dorcoceras hygrometricum]|uniref:Uncharacterized protein n=1 Tax=Dorcoceras hygrometricum TaxID=472368 RepID=A0A2Z7A0V6_9LAMI|nr:hypothetical protein F511_46302 [Dorcoceras hygrometricum]